jgi:cellobiose phosphorylase
MEKFCTFLSDGISFQSTRAADLRLIYAPLCAPSSRGLKSSVTPLLSGDIKIDRSRYLTRPASREDLRAPVRNFFIRVPGRGVVSLADDPDGNITVEAGQLWHRVVRDFPALGLRAEALNFVPVTGEDAEVMTVCLTNTSAAPVEFFPTAVLPVFGRSLENKHDHEHVTALLHRIEQHPSGVLVEPTMRFNEEGHRENRTVYYVLGQDASGRPPAGTFPTAASFLGEDGTWSRPSAVREGREPALLSDAERDGQEAAGALSFGAGTLKPGESARYFLVFGIAAGREGALKDFYAFNTEAKCREALERNRSFWSDKTSSIVFDGGDADFTAWMRWVTLQPVLRRIYGCSFLPDHDYGKGGKGWRDIWQDLLSLILIEPAQVRENLLNNYGGVRIDGSNATIIGERPGEFIADRNAITRVWMDHGVWPFLTTLLYIDQTGDWDFLFEEAPYFADPQMARTTLKDASWSAERGSQLKDREGKVYRGTVLEHIIIENLVQFFNVGEHNMVRLESADWNDGLDMAFARGESVAFSAFYGGNLVALADLLSRVVEVRGRKPLAFAKEIFALTDTLSRPLNYDSPAEKQQRLFGEYFRSVQPFVSGERVEICPLALAEDLRKKGRWMIERINRQEQVSVRRDGEDFTWFNGYYDNNGERVEGLKAQRVRMTLTGQVFPVMCGAASGPETRQVIRAVDRFLKDRGLGGFRLNTDFGLRTYLAMGRAFAFAFGTKENGAVFSHMAVMYAYALYKQNFSREGYDVLRSLYVMSTDPRRAMIYPGIPEYFDPQGRGMYHFLTGSASWYVLTLLTMACGVRGEGGDLLLAPQLVKEEFSGAGEARITCQFAGKKLAVTYLNPERRDAGDYRVTAVHLNGVPARFERRSDAVVLLKRELFSFQAGQADLRVMLAAR